MKKNLIHLTLSVVMFFLTAQLFAAITLIDENFDSYTDGQLPPAPWSGGGNGSIYVTGSDGFEDSKSLLVVNPDTNTTGIKSLVNVTGKSDAETLVFQYKIKTQKQPKVNQWGSLIRLLCGNKELIRTRWQGNSLIYSTENSGGCTTEEIIYNADTTNWHTFKAIIDVKTRTVDLYWDSILIRDDIRLFTNSTSIDTSTFKLELGFWPGGSNNYTHYYDNITLNASVEDIILLDENFESHTVGNQPNDPWTPEGGDSSQVAIINIEAASGAKCLEIIPASEDTYGVQKVLNLNGEENPLLIIQYKIKISKHASANKWGSFVRLLCGTTEIFRTRWYGKSLRYSTSNNTNTQILTNDDESKWHDFKAVINRITRRVDIYWDDAMKCNDMPLYNWTEPDSWANINVEIGIWPGGSVDYENYYDDLKIISTEHYGDHVKSLVRENFDSYSVGEQPGGAWQEMGNADQITVEKPDDHSNSLSFVTPSNSSYAFQCLRGLNAEADPLLVFQYDIKTAATPSGWGSLIQIYSDNTEFFRTRWDGNNLLYFATGNEVYTVKASNDTASWHTFKAVIDQVKQNVDIYWDGKAVAIDLPFINQASPANWKNVELRLGFWSGGSDEYIHYYDEIKLTAGEINPVESYDYMPEHAHGDFKMTMHPRRFIELSWRDWNILSQGGEFFTRNYLSGTTYKSPVGWYLVTDNLVGFDSPVRVETSEDGTTYTWVGDDAGRGYRQINRASITDQRFVLRTTLEFSNNIPGIIRFQPVFFPGREVSYRSAETDSSMPGTICTLYDSGGNKTDVTYPDPNVNPPAFTDPSWGGVNWRSIVVKHAKKFMRISFRSNISDVTANIFPLTSWPFSSTQGDRKGLNTEFVFNSPTNVAPFSLTYEIIIEPIDEGAPVVTPPPLVAVTTQDLKLIPHRPIEDQKFWFFRPHESADFSVEVSNKWSNEGRSGSLLCEVRDYGNSLIKTISTAIDVPSEGTSEYDIAIGNLPAGIYSVTLQATDSNGYAMGYTVFRVGVIPNHEISNYDTVFGGFKYNNFHVEDQVTLSTWLGMGIMRFRAGNGEEEWHKFEATKGIYTGANDLIGPAQAQLYKNAGINLIHDGLPFPPNIIPTWLDEDKVDVIFERGGKNAFLPTNRQLFIDYIKAWAGNYVGLIDYFEVFNEPPEADKDDMAEVVTLVKSAVEQVTPYVATADINKITTSSVEWLDDLVKTAGDAVSIITYHHYKTGWFKRNRYMRFPVIEDLGWEDDVAQIVDIGTKYGKPVWNGEISWIGSQRELFAYPTFEEGEQDTTNIVIRSYLLNRAAGVIRTINCFATTISDPNLAYLISPERTGAAIGWQRQIKPWAVAHATLARLLDDASFIRRIDYNNSKIYVLCFRVDDHAFAAAWITHGSTEIENPFLASEVELLGVDGRSLQHKEQLLLTQEPIYLVGNIDWEDFVLRLESATGQ